jgi:hypothetical protein
MRFVAAALVALVAAPALAQEVRVPHAPPPEGFYRNINGAYDLLFRPYVSSDIQLVDERRLLELLERRLAERERATPAPPPCEPPPTANAPAAKPAGPSPCPATR